MAAVRQNAGALQYAPEKMRQELKEEARFLNASVQEYCMGAANPRIITLFSSEGNETPLKISCRNLAGKEVLSFEPGAANDAEKLRRELAKALNVHPCALHLLNQRGEILRDC